jgi:hypothetical protein
MVTLDGRFSELLYRYSNTRAAERSFPNQDAQLIWFTVFAQVNKIFIFPPQTLPYAEKVFTPSNLYYFLLI